MSAKFLAAIAVLGLASGSVACERLKPADGKKQHSADQIPVPVGQVKFALNHESVLALTEAAAQLRVRVYKMVDNAPTVQEGQDQLFAMASEEEHLYSVQGVTLGMKEFDLDVLNANGETIGDAKVPYLVKLGVQSLENKVSITLHDPARRRRDVPVEIFVNLDGAPGQSNLTTYVDVKDIFSRKDAVTGKACVTCHSGAEPAADLDLAAFPFKYAVATTQDKLVAEIIDAISDVQYPMPPSPNTRVPDDGIALIKKWLADGLLAAPAPSDDLNDLATDVVLHYSLPNTNEKGDLYIARGTDADHPFQSIWKGAVVLGKYDLSVDVIARDDSLTHSEVLTPQLVDELTSLQWTVKVPYAAPVVNLPVVIHGQ